MAYLHQTGWIAPTGQELKSCTTIDDETLQLFKTIVAEKATTYERFYVAPMGRELADQIKADRTLESLMRHEYSKLRWAG
jgi:hypothetical protein